MIRLQELELVFGQTNGRMDRQTDRRDVGNSILDKNLYIFYLKVRRYETLQILFSQIKGIKLTYGLKIRKCDFVMPIDFW